LDSIEGQLPALDNLPQGCRFHPRCEYAIAPCKSGEIALEAVGPDHDAACIRWRELKDAAA
jgi:oligopeptide/dipeptide ABC transporter ATP-binding protein